MRVLVVRVESSNRSRMAEAFARMHGDGRVEENGAGSRPSGAVNPRAIEMRGERSYGLAAHQSKSLDEISGGAYDFVVTMGCGDALIASP